MRSTTLIYPAAPPSKDGWRMRRYTLRTLLALLALALAVALTIGLAALIDGIASAQLEERIGRQLVSRTLELGDKIDLALSDRYREIQLQADALSRLGLTARPDAVRVQLDSILRRNESYAWIGYADTAGRVAAASDGILEGVDVSARPWFRGATHATFLGDLHRAVLLENKLSGDGGELRLIDIAAPLTDPAGMFAGVLGAHVDWRWVKSISGSLPRLAHSDVLLVNADGAVLLGPAELQDQPLALESVRQARRGQAGYHVELWPDGRTYLTGYSKSQGHGEYPGLGWIVVERQEIGVAFAPVRTLSRQILGWGGAVAALFALLGWAAATRIAGPMNAITRAAERLQAGQKTEIPDAGGYWEAAMLGRTLRRLLADLTRRESELEHQATHDTLTQLPNRALMKAVLTQAIARAARDERRLAVAAVNLDRFKNVNDIHGHATGDAVLRVAAERLAACVDTAGTLGHLGGDKFILLLEDQDGLLRGTRLIHRVQEALAQRFRIGGGDFFLSASVGVSLYPDNGQDAETLLAYAELAQHQARQDGGNAIVFYEAQTNAALQRRLSLERDLRRALQERQFALHYQPQVAAADGAVVGVEALLRWHHPVRGPIPPADFIPALETSGLILPIGDWVLRTACAQAVAWQRAGLPALRIGVNVSAQQFADANLVERVGHALRESGLQPGLLKLEITESPLMREVERSIATMQALRALGVHLAIDDFGTGYSSLACMKRFPVGELKIDRAFVRDLPAEPGDAAIVRAVIALGHNLRMSVTAEGVETAAQADFLKRAGCDHMQGYLFGRPQPAQEIERLLAGRQG